jgi:hypothetical protein
MTEVSHLKKAEQGLEICKRSTFCRESYGQRFLGFSGRLIHRFSDRTTNHQHRSLVEAFKRPNEVNLSFKTTRSISQIVCLLQDNAPPYTATVTTGALEEMHWEMLPHPAYSTELVPSDFYLFGPLKEVLEGKIFRADNEVKLFLL